MLDLEIVDSKDLIKELLNRFKEGIVILERPCRTKDEGCEFWENYNGTNSTCTGLLAQALSRRLAAHIITQIKDDYL